MKKIFAMLLSIVVLFSLCACTGDRQGNTGSTPTTITIGVTNNNNEFDNMKVFRRAFESKFEAEGYKIEIVPITGEYSEGVMRMAYSKTLPDAIMVYDDTSVFWTAQGIYQKLDEYIDRDNIDLSLYVDSMIDIARSGQDDNSLYWIPRDYDKLITIVNKKVFADAGVAIPNSTEFTWSKMLEVCEELKTNTGRILSANPDISRFYPVGMKCDWAPIYYTMFKNFNLEMCKDGSPLYGDRQNIYNCLQLMRDLQDNGYMNYGGNINAMTGEIAMIIGNTRTNIPSYEDYDIDYAVLPFPTQINGNSFVGCGATGYAMTTACPTEKREIVWQFLKFLMTEEGQNAMGRSSAIIPTMKSILEDPNSQWKLTTPDIDNGVFYEDFSRDIKVTYLQDFKPATCHKGIYSKFSEMMSKLFVDNFDGKGSIEGLYNYYEKQIKAEMVE